MRTQAAPFYLEKSNSRAGEREKYQQKCSQKCAAASDCLKPTRNLFTLSDKLIAFKLHEHEKFQFSAPLENLVENYCVCNKFTQRFHLPQNSTWPGDVSNGEQCYGQMATDIPAEHTHIHTHRYTRRPTPSCTERKANWQSNRNVCKNCLGFD